jgi:tetratricopeptide (TPR) repeat protein
MSARLYSTEFVRRITSRALLLACVTVTPLQAQSALPPLNGAARWADSARVQIERAVYANDAAALAGVGTMIDRALTAFPNDPLLLHYRAYQLYREVMGRTDGGDLSDAMEQKLKSAIEMLERSAAARPLAETEALRSSCLGTLAGTGMVNGMRYGSAASEAGAAARALGPNNPRVALLAGIAAWFTPSMWGGGKDKGYALVQQAISAFAHDQPARPLPSWGSAEAYAWLGQMEKERGNVTAARTAYDRALAIAPEFRWVRDQLRPALGAAR